MKLCLWVKKWTGIIENWWIWKGKKNKNGDIVIDVDNDMRDDVKIMGNDMNNDRRDRIEIGRINRYLDEYSSEVKFNRKKL